VSTALLANGLHRSASSEVIVRRVDRIADGIAAIQLQSASDRPLPEWAPGSHVDVLTPVGWRSYSLCGQVSQPSWLIAVQHEPAGRGGSAWMHQLQAGDRLSVLGPRNNFPLVGGSRYLMIAGGIGVTPLLPMVSALESRGADWEMVYGARSIDAMAFRDDLQRYGDRVVLWPDDRRGPLPVQSILTADHDVATTVYCCGPNGLIDAVEQLCREDDRLALHIERFQQIFPQAATEEGSEFEVVLASSGQRLRVGPNDTILGVLESAGVMMAWSCRQGQCGTCELRVLAGRPDHRDDVLGHQERVAGDRIITCVSRAATEELTLDI